MAGLYCTRMPTADLATQIMDGVYNDFHFRWQIYRLFIVQPTSNSERNHSQKWHQILIKTIAKQSIYKGAEECEF